MRPEKQFLLDEIKDKIDGSKALLFTRYQKLTPNLASTLRSMLAQSGDGFEVVKKRILAKAAAESGFQVDLNAMEGHIAVVFASNDPIQTTKAIYQFKQSNEDILEVLGGRFEGKLYGAEDIEQISKLPSKEEMRSQLLATFEAPLSLFLGTVDAALCSVPYCLENKNQS